MTARTRRSPAKSVTVNCGHLYYGDPASANPPPAASSGRRYQGGVSFEDTLVDVGDSSALLKVNDRSEHAARRK